MVEMGDELPRSGGVEDGDVEKKKEWKHKREMVSNVQDHQKKRSYICKLTHAQYKRFVFIK